MAKTVGDVTLVIPTHNRHALLLRVLKFYSSYDEIVPTVILDSSALKPQDPDLLEHLKRPHITYVRYPAEPVPRLKFSEGLAMIKTPYAFFCADDDFVSLAAVKVCVEFLTKHPDFALCQGHIYSHVPTAAKTAQAQEWVASYPLQTSLEQETACGRFTNYLSHYHGATFYAVHRTEVLQSIWKATAANVTDWGLFELVPGALSVIAGKFKHLPVFYAGRSSEVSGQHTVSSSHLRWYEKPKVAKAVACWAEHLSERDNISLDAALQIAGDVFSQYMRNNDLVGAPPNLTKKYWGQLRPWIVRTLSDLKVKKALQWIRHYNQDYARALRSSLSREERKRIRTFALHAEH